MISMVKIISCSYLFQESLLYFAFTLLIDGDGGTITLPNVWIRKGVLAGLSVSSFTVVCNLMVLNTYEWMDILLYYVCHVMVFVALDFIVISAPRYVCGLNQI